MHRVIHFKIILNLYFSKYMKTLIATSVIFISSLFFAQATAQIEVETHPSDSNSEIEELQAKKVEIEKEEKDKLKEELVYINELLREGKIDSLEAETQKKKAAKKAALNIEDRLDIVDSQIALLERNEDKKFTLSLELFGEDKKKKSNPKSTESGLTLAFGFNNAIAENQSLDDSPYKIGGSRFFEIGWDFNTRFTDFMGIRYGLSFQFNGLKPEKNYYFVEESEQTVLKEHPQHLDKSKFRNDNLVIPIHLEFKPFESDKTYFSQNRFKLGLGGYLGVNLNTVQKLKFEEDGNNRKIKLKEGYHTSNFIYGLSAYIGYDIYALYLKYDLNPIFTDNTIEEKNVSLGVRIAF